VHNETQRAHCQALIAPQPDTLISMGNPRVHECHLIKASRRTPVKEKWPALFKSSGGSLNSRPRILKLMHTFTKKRQ
jgi:hypothetical protein